MIDTSGFSKVELRHYFRVAFEETVELTSDQLSDFLTFYGVLLAVGIPLTLELIGRIGDKYESVGMAERAKKALVAPHIAWWLIVNISLVVLTKLMLKAGWDLTPVYMSCLSIMTFAITLRWVCTISSRALRMMSADKMIGDLVEEIFVDIDSSLKLNRKI